jgi:hypothetical protein
VGVVFVLASATLGLVLAFGAGADLLVVGVLALRPSPIAGCRGLTVCTDGAL